MIKMDYLYYQRKINDVIIKCPIEAGIEILVYNLLDENVDMKQYSLVDINGIWKNQDSRLSTEAGISDIAILSPNFEFKKEDIGAVYGFVEVKAAGYTLGSTEQILGQVKKVAHFIYTNGIVWQYYFCQKLKWEKNLGIDKLQHSIAKIMIDKNEFEELKQEIQKINWNEPFVATNNSL